jgi:hypothetical protein
MTTLGLRECDHLDGDSNFTSWKYHLQILLGDMDLSETIEYIFVSLNNAITLLISHKKSASKVNRILKDSLNDNLIPRIMENSVNERYATLIALY